MIIGVLALQGAFQKHIDMLNHLQVSTKKVRYYSDFTDIDALIIPGGESTTLSNLIVNENLFNKISDFVCNKPVFGTCAGLILLSNKSQDDTKVISFNSLNVKVERNGWGRQVDSFQTIIDIKTDSNKSYNFNGVFIRAPKITSCNGTAKVLSSLNGSPVMVRDGMTLGTTFHPELTDDLRIHEYFIDMIREYDNIRKN